ncbi:DsbA family protein [uncultured Microscilla sp.]|uniref:DsbA family protein n=1 Tax=uncultured Microscilla sp. TaxID=432653 RepID=UPI00262688ED|nr:DsbA family protein [uncultured Microscilla sp.]
MTDNKTIRYFADPMCSWCWGAAASVTRLKEQYHEFDFELIMGGLRPYETRPLDANSRDKLIQHWRQIGEATEQPFDETILHTPGFVYNTEAAARAVVTVKKINPAMTFVFFKAVQKAFYAEGKHPQQLSTYLELCQNMGISAEEFARIFELQTTKEATEEEFMRAKTFYGITGFPTLLLQFGAKAKPIARGYLPYEQMEQNIEQILMKYAK